MKEISRLLFAFAGLALIVGSARADGTQLENEDSRFTFYRAEKDFLRLDGRTGAVSICTRRPVGWLCQAIPEERAAFEAEITRLQADNAALKRVVLAHDLPLPGGIRPEVPSEDETRLQGAKQSVRHFVNVIGGIWRRIVAAIDGVQKDLRKKS